MFGLSYDKPAAHMKEYLAIIAPLLRGEAVDFEGQQLTGRMTIELDQPHAVPLLVAALGPVMLKLAGEHAAGTTTWMTGPKTIESHILPKISTAASAAGRPAPRIVCGLPIALTNDVTVARETIAEQLQIYGLLPSYRAMLDKEGVDGPADLALVGDEASLRASIQHLRDVGVTDFNAVIIPVGEGSREATLDFLQSELA